MGTRKISFWVSSTSTGSYVVEYDDIEREVTRAAEIADHDLWFQIQPGRYRDQVVYVDGELSFEVSWGVYLSDEDEKLERELLDGEPGPLTERLEKILDDFVQNFDWPEVYVDTDAKSGLDVTVMWVPHFDMESRTVIYNANIC